MGNRGISFNGVPIAAHRHKQLLLRAFARVIDRGIFLNGPEADSLENHIAHVLGKGSVISVSSGHDALTLSLQSLRLSKDSEVIFPVNAYPTAFPVSISGLKPVPVDVDANGQLDPVSVIKAITKQTRVIIMVHLYGLVGNLSAIKILCRKHRIILIEDAAQAFGTVYQHQKVGTLGDIGCFSFYPTKNLGSLGEGGAIWTKHPSIYRYIRRAKLYGERKRYYSTFISGHSNTIELLASGLLVYLQSFPTEAKKRQRVASFYTSIWHASGLSKYGYILQSSPQSNPVPHLLVISVTHRSALRRYLSTHGVPTAIHYPVPIHKTPPFIPIIPSHLSYPTADQLAKRMISLPFHQYMTKSDVRYIISTIKRFYETAAH